MSAAHASVHVVPPRVYVAVFAALMVLTAITTAAAYVDLGPVNAVIMLGIAVLKATLVVLWFMHVRYSNQVTRVVLVASAIFIVILVVSIAGDVLLRARLPGVFGRGWVAAGDAGR
jgi:cytochrome c oxidase subunit 4